MLPQKGTIQLPPQLLSKRSQKLSVDKGDQTTETKIDVSNCLATHTAEDREGKVTCNLNCPKLAIPTLVPQAPASVDQETHSTASTEDQCPLALQEGQTSSSWGEAQTDGLSFVRRSLANKGFSAAVQATICNSWRSNTQKQYNTYLAKWELFTGKRGVDPLSPPVGIV